MGARGWISVLLGAFLLFLSGSAGLATWRWVGRTAVARGRVVRLNAGGSHPQITFTASSGEEVSYPQGGLVAGWRVGDAVAVRYDPKAPARDPCIDRLLAIWSGPLALLVIGGGLALLGLAARATP